MIQAIQVSQLKANIIQVISNNADAQGLKLAQEAGIETKVIPSKGNTHFFSDLKNTLSLFEFDFIVLAGFMRIIPEDIVQEYKHRIINIHPSLLPQFPGLDAQRQALEAGANESGCTVHLVDEGCDTGPILAQAKVPIIANDTVESLSARILVEEHKILAQTLEKIRQKGFKVQERQVLFNT